MQFASVNSFSFPVRRATALVLAVLFANLTACTVYVPVTGAINQTSPQKVRVTLTDAGSVSVAPKIGQRARIVQGVLQEMTDSTITVVVTQVSREGGIEDSYAGDALTFTRGDYEKVEQGKTSVSRSLLLAGAIIAGAFAVAVGAGELSGGDGGGPPQHEN